MNRRRPRWRQRKSVVLGPRVANRGHQRVYDCIRWTSPARVVCTDCGEQWWEGADWIPYCKKQRANLSVKDKR